MHPVIHQALQNNGERQSVNGKKAEEETRNEKDKQKFGGGRSNTKVGALLERQLLATETFTNASLIQIHRVY